MKLSMNICVYLYLFICLWKNDICTDVLKDRRGFWDGGNMLNVPDVGKSLMYSQNNRGVGYWWSLKWLKQPKFVEIGRDK